MCWIWHLLIYSSSLGKTAPRLLQDLLLYDPCHPPSSGYNLLADLPVPFEKARQLPAIRGKGSCEHRLVLKPNQCLLPKHDTKPDPSTVYQLAAHCLECRCHVSIVVDYRGEGAGLMPCPTEDAPLHHFLPVSDPNGRLEGGDGTQGHRWVQSQRFRCSSPTCCADVTIQIRPPRLTPEWVTLLSDKDAIRERAEKVMAEDPVRFEGHALPPPVQVLMNLRIYLANAMKDPEGRRILGNNKKWMLCLGDACADLLEYLGFTRQASFVDVAGRWMKTDRRDRIRTGGLHVRTRQQLYLTQSRSISSWTMLRRSCLP